MSTVWNMYTTNRILGSIMKGISSRYDVIHQGSQAPGLMEGEQRVTRKVTIVASYT
jgi:hypothetical protein